MFNPAALKDGEGSEPYSWWLDFCGIFLPFGKDARANQHNRTAGTSAEPEGPRLVDDERCDCESTPWLFEEEWEVLERTLKQREFFRENFGPFDGLMAVKATLRDRDTREARCGITIERQEQVEEMNQGKKSKMSKKQTKQLGVRAR
jgi:hypothetical protein